jgi:hypothetical protein
MYNFRQFRFLSVVQCGGDGADVDLSDYYTKAEVDTLLQDYVNVSDGTWKVTKPIDYVTGALPRSGDFSSSGGTLILFVSGYAYFTVGGDSVIGVDVDIDGSDVGDALLYANEASSHKIIVSSAIVATGFTAGNYTVHLTAHSGTETDTNDVHDVLVYELPF